MTLADKQYWTHRAGYAMRLKMFLLLQTDKLPLKWCSPFTDMPNNILTFHAVLFGNRISDTLLPYFQRETMAHSQHKISYWHNKVSVFANQISDSNVPTTVRQKKFNGNNDYESTSAYQKIINLVCSSSRVCLASGYIISSWLTRYPWQPDKTQVYYY